MKAEWYFLVVVIVAVLACPGNALSAANKPASVAELALYKGPDRQRILEEGAKREGKLTFYTTHVANAPLVAAFQKKYPFLKVEVWRADTNVIASRVIEENKMARNGADAIEGTQMVNQTLQKLGLVQSYYSPHIAVIEEDAITRAPDGNAFSVSFREGYIGLGYNTKLIPKGQIPKTYEDLLDPKWKGIMPIAGSSTGSDWMGTMLTVKGEDFVKRVAAQDFKIHMVSARAILDMIINGEYRFSPTIYESHIIDSKKKGAPVDWIPIEPVHVNSGQIALSRNAPNPHAALLLIDFELSKEAAEMNKATGFTSARKDMPDEATYKKFYGIRSVEEGRQWTNLFNQLFLKR